MLLYARILEKRLPLWNICVCEHMYPENGSINI